MKEDGAGAMLRLRARTAVVIEPLLAEHRARRFRDTGDGFIADALPNALDHWSEINQ